MLQPPRQQVKMRGMTTSRHYSRSPVAEAIIDFQVELPEGVGLADLERCQDAAYPLKKALADSAGQIKLVKDELTSPAVGFLFISADQKQLFQAHLKGCTMHRLAPYAGWEPFRDEARRLWNTYRQTARPLRVARVALRYVNRLNLPLPVAELKDYLRTSPEVSPDLPQELAGFFMQLNIPLRDIKSTLLLRQMGPGVPPGAAVVRGRLIHPVRLGE
jgi:uncharacterized protein (TIGR04255 family)